MMTAAVAAWRQQARAAAVISRKHSEAAATATRDGHCIPTPGHSDQSSATVVQPASAPAASTAAAATVATVIAATSVGSTVTATPAAPLNASGPVAASGAKIADSAAADCSATLATTTAIATVAVASATPLPSTAGASPSAAVSSSSSSSSSSSAPAALKKCACCHRLLPDGDYSGAQLKAKGKRQCKVCVAGLQASQNDLLSCNAVAGQLQRLPFADVVERLSSPAKSERLKGLRDLVGELRAPGGTNVGGSNVGRTTSLVVGVLCAAREPQTKRIRSLALESIAFMGNGPALLAQMVAAGVIPILLQLLRPSDQQPALTASETFWNAHAVAHIAMASRANCDALLAAGALASLLPFVRPDMSADLSNELLPTLVCLMGGRPAAEMAEAVTHLGALLMDDTAPPELLCVCLNTFGNVIFGFAHGDPNLDSWVESTLAAAPGFPHRLVALLGGAKGPQLTEVVLRLMNNLFKAKTVQLRQLFDCGLLDQLLHLLLSVDGVAVRLLAAQLCSNAAGTKDYAPLLVGSAPIVQRLLTLLSTSEGEMLHRVASFFLNVLGRRDRSLTGRLINEHRALLPLVSALRRAIAAGDQASTVRCLRSVASVLIVGEAEAVDDERGINPYIEPLDWLGVFELADPLQNSADARMAEVARRVFSYFIPNDCE